MIFIIFTEGLAIDWINDKIYWTDTDQDTIEVAGISGSPRTVLISRTEHDDPTGIVVDPASKLVLTTHSTHTLLDTKGYNVICR